MRESSHRGHSGGKPPVIAWPHFGHRSGSAIVLFLTAAGRVEVCCGHCPLPRVTSVRIIAYPDEPRERWKLHQAEVLTLGKPTRTMRKLARVRPSSPRARSSSLSRNPAVARTPSPSEVAAR